MNYNTVAARDGSEESREVSWCQMAVLSSQDLSPGCIHNSCFLSNECTPVGACWLQVAQAAARTRDLKEGQGLGNKDPAVQQSVGDLLRLKVREGRHWASAQVLIGGEVHGLQLYLSNHSSTSNTA